MTTLRTRTKRRLALVLALVAGSIASTALPTSPVSAASTNPFSTYFMKNGTSPISGIKIFGYDGKNVLASIALATGSTGTLTVTPNAGTTLSYGFTSYTGSSLSFSGPFEAVKQAVSTLRYTSPATNAVNKITVNTMFTEAKGNLAYFPANQHFYEYVKYPEGTSVADKATDKAHAAAKASTQFGLTGYLANITSAAENDFVSTKLEGAKDVWIGGSDETTEGTWVFTDGPEKGKNFWNGCSAESPVTPGSAPAGAFAAWAPGDKVVDREPNNWETETNYCGGDNYAPNAGKGEDCIVTNKSSGDKRYIIGYWNDFPCSGAGSVTGYVVEYGSATDSSAYPTGVDIGRFSMVAITASQKPTLMDKIFDIIGGKPKKKAFVKVKKQKLPPDPVKFKGGKIVRPTGKNCGNGPVYELKFEVTSSKELTSSDRFSVYFTNSVTNKLIPFAACSTIDGRVLLKDYSVPVIRNVNQGKKIKMTALLPARVGKVELNIINQVRNPDGTFKLYRAQSSNSFTIR